MKKPTTEFAIAMQKRVQLNREFLLSQGWELDQEKPLYENFTHPADQDIKCSIGLYGQFGITQFHWCNGTPERAFYTCNPDLTEADYFKILEMLRFTHLLACTPSEGEDR